MNSFSISVMEICKEEQKKEKKRYIMNGQGFSVLGNEQLYVGFVKVNFHTTICTSVTSKDTSTRKDHCCCWLC